MEVGVPAVRIYAEYEVTFLSLENISCIFVANIFFSNTVEPFVADTS